MFYGLLIQGHFWRNEMARGAGEVACGSSELGMAMTLSDTIILPKTSRFVEDTAQCLTFSKSS